MKVGREGNFRLPGNIRDKGAKERKENQYGVTEIIYSLCLSSFVNRPHGAEAEVGRPERLRKDGPLFTSVLVRKEGVSDPAVPIRGIHTSQYHRGLGSRDEFGPLLDVLFIAQFCSSISVPE